MLVLKLNIDEAVTLTLPDGRVLTVTAVDLRRHTVRIGFDAPRDIPIIRNELIDSRAEDECQGD